MLREVALEYLKTRNANPGDTVQMGWFVFRIVATDHGLDLLTLDFKALGAFTGDFEISDRVHWAQRETLRCLGAAATDCSLAQPALVSRSYSPGSRQAFIERSQPTNESDSGWYVGMLGDSLDMGNAGSFVHQSLYELSIHDQRLVRFWLLPVGYRVLFDHDDPRIEKVEPAAPNAGIASHLTIERHRAGVGEPERSA
jgi:hypothetical protein